MLYYLTGSCNVSNSIVLIYMCIIFFYFVYVCVSRGRRRLRRKMKSLLGWRKALWTNSLNRFVSLPILILPSPFFAVNHFFSIYTLSGSLKANHLSVQVISYSTTCPGVFPLLILNLIVLVFLERCNQSHAVCLLWGAFL